MALYIGTCGFSYQDWIGPFYPPGIKPLEMLPYYAQRFPAVEIDSTYYAIPKAQLFESMHKRTPGAFRFTVKAPGTLTHAGADAPARRQDARDFEACLQPLLTAGKLAGVLAQFPNGFRPGPSSFARMEELREWWPDLPLIAEFRNREWQRDDTLQRLRALQIGWCNVDQPGFRSLMKPGAEVTSSIGYIRFHGRNYGSWWKHDRPSHERYSYLYSQAELEPWIPRIAEVTEEAQDAYVFFNNHHLGQAAINARQLGDMLGLNAGQQAPAGKTGAPGGSTQEGPADLRLL
jgi:uncharacterized protein YecE (DUF72 family)